MTHLLKDRAIVVTGGFGVLGRALATYLLEQGARVAAVDLSGMPSDLEVSDDFLPLGGVDLTDPVSAADAMAKVAKALGHIDSLVNVAGGFAWEPFETGALETWDRMYQMNVRTTVSTTHAALPYLLESADGRVISISAIAADKAGMGVAAYAASKAGVSRFTESLAEELKARGVTVNAVMPSIIDTPTNRADMPDQDFSSWVAPSALAAVIGFLLSAQAGVITGACLPVTGKV
ncbi:hypothetical protein LCGC14_0493630 [marine sediment metagenome]|uniref:Ketoreductase domain-containing protein n=1 Tax=marine sediment metagenome TaxID=412755 RepID=A0A0F9USY5_9ZZZZ|nr:SDR family NAD(P)-dependent oxidoreductase [Halopseudomonas sabulinigri]